MVDMCSPASRRALRECSTHIFKNGAMLRALWLLYLCAMCEVCVRERTWGVVRDSIRD